MIRVEEGFQLPDATAFEGDIRSFTAARIQIQQVPDVNATQYSRSLLLIQPISSVLELVPPTPRSPIVLN